MENFIKVTLRRQYKKIKFSALIKYNILYILSKKVKDAVNLESILLCKNLN